MRAQTYTIPFLFKEKVAHETYAFYFRRPKEFTFISGQYNRWTLPFIAQDQKGSSRFFSVSSPPNNKEIIAFTTRIEKSEFKQNLLMLNKNDNITVFGPMGKFFIDKDDTKAKVFLAGGMGITPFGSFLASKPTMPLTLIASFKNPNAVINLDMFKKSPHIKIIYTLTDSFDMWSGEKGRISEKLIKRHVSNRESSIFYIAGPPLMVEEIQIILSSMGISEADIKHESYI